MKYGYYKEHRNVNCQLPLRKNWGKIKPIELARDISMEESLNKQLSLFEGISLEDYLSMRMFENYIAMGYDDLVCDADITYTINDTGYITVQLTGVYEYKVIRVIDMLSNLYVDEYSVGDLDSETRWSLKDDICVFSKLMRYYDNSSLVRYIESSRVNH